MDSNPRTFYLTVTEIEANVDADATGDHVIIEFAGRVTPTIRARFGKAFAEGRFDFVDKRLV